MRLIDADALEAQWTIASPEPYSTDAAEVLATIREAPTVEAKVAIHGYWIKEASYFDEDCYCMCYDYSCSNCGEIVTDKSKLPKYCPECGSRNEVKK